METNREGFRPSVPDISKIRVVKPDQQKERDAVEAAKRLPKEKKLTPEQALMSDFNASKQKMQDENAELLKKLKADESIFGKPKDEQVH